MLAALAGCGERQQALGEPDPPQAASHGRAPSGTTVPGANPSPPAPGVDALPANLVVSTNEPFWQARVDGDQLVLAGIDTVRRLQVVSSRIEAGMRVVRAADQRGEVLLTARLKPCSDDMSGAPFPLSGTLQVGDQGPHRGCGRALGPPPPAASGDAAMPALPAAFHGHWANDLAACSDPRDSSGHVHVAARELRFHESIAVPVEVQPVNATTLNVTLDYTGEGERWRSRQGLQLSGNDTLTIEGPDDIRVRRVRCPLAG